MLTDRFGRVHDYLRISLTESCNFRCTYCMPDEFQTDIHQSMRMSAEEIDLLLQHNFEVKVNVVVMKGVNDDELIDFVQWTRDFPLHVRFIEFMPFDGNHWNREKVFPYKEMLDRIGAFYEVMPLKNEKHD